MPSNYPLDVEVLRKALHRAEGIKEAEGGRRCARAGWDYIGAAFSTWGGAGPSGKKLLNKILKITCNGLSLKGKSEKGAQLSKRISMAPAKGMATQLRARDRV